ncbi:hypothetical protein E4T56_gene6823 [Termitomyces sp. T112]|nr:hypothetical protein E4T56_gene6823 [Termitomyces sp. T112]
MGLLLCFALVSHYSLSCFLHLVDDSEGLHSFVITRYALIPVVSSILWTTLRDYILLSSLDQFFSARPAVKGSGTSPEASTEEQSGEVLTAVEKVLEGARGLSEFARKALELPGVGMEGVQGLGSLLGHWGEDFREYQDPQDMGHRLGIGGAWESKPSNIDQTAASGSGMGNKIEAWPPFIRKLFPSHSKLTGAHAFNFQDLSLLPGGGADGHRKGIGGVGSAGAFVAAGGPVCGGGGGMVGLRGEGLDSGRGPDWEAVGGVAGWVWEHWVLMDGASTAFASIQDGLAQMPTDHPPELDQGVIRMGWLLVGYQWHNAVVPGSWWEVAVDVKEELPRLTEVLAMVRAQMEVDLGVKEVRRGAPECHDPSPGPPHIVQQLPNSPIIPDALPNCRPCPTPILVSPDASSANSDASPANSDGPLANFDAFPAATDTYPGSPEP